MKKLNYIALSAASIGIIGISAVGVASAATPSSSGDVGTSGIPRSVFKEEKLDAESQVLDTSTANIQTAHKNKTFKDLVTSAGFKTRATYKEALVAQLTKDLEAQGYTQNQITIALQHRDIVRLRHHHDK